MHSSGSFAPQVTKTPEATVRDRKSPKGKEEPKAVQEASHTPPTPASQQSPACHCRDQPLAAHIVPFVAHSEGHQPNSFKFVFYKPSFSNSYRPFYTAQKPACGYNYHRNTDHTRKVMDIQSVEVTKW